MAFMVICVFTFLCLRNAYYTTPYGDEEYVKECRANVGKYVRICDKEYKVIQYYPQDDTYLLDCKDKIKSHFVNNSFYSK